MSSPSRIFSLPTIPINRRGGDYSSRCSYLGLCTLGSSAFVALHCSGGQLYRAALCDGSWEPLFSLRTCSRRSAIVQGLCIAGDWVRRRVVVCSSLRLSISAHLLSRLPGTHIPADRSLVRIHTCTFRILCITYGFSGFFVLDFKERLYILDLSTGLELIEQPPHSEVSSFPPRIAFVRALRCVVVVGSYGVYAKILGGLSRGTRWVAVSLDGASVTLRPRPSLVAISGDRLVLRPGYGDGATGADPFIYVLSVRLHLHSLADGHPCFVWPCRRSTALFGGGDLVVTGLHFTLAHESLFICGWVRTHFVDPVGSIRCDFHYDPPLVLLRLIGQYYRAEMIHCVSLLRHQGAYVSSL